MLQQFSDIVWPDAASYWIANARIPVCMLSGPHGFTPHDREDGAALLDILIVNGRIERLVPARNGSADQRPSVDLKVIG